MKRRNFLKTGAASLLLGPSTVTAFNSAEYTSLSSERYTITEVIEIIKSQIPGSIPNDTVDTIKVGDSSQEVTGIVTTFMCTIDVIERAKWLGANLIITHEPTFYNHRDETDWLSSDQVYLHKVALLKKYDIVVWRFHDLWHQYRPDGILTGFLRKMNWEAYQDKIEVNMCEVPQIKLKALAQHIKRQFALKRTFYIGDPEMSCRKIGLLPGAWGGRAHIKFLNSEIDTLIVGESAEWEGVEYVRDASLAGFQKSMIIMGHAQSEEPGMAYLKDWLAPLVPGVQISHIAAGDPMNPV